MNNKRILLLLSSFNRPFSLLKNRVENIRFKTLKRKVVFEVPQNYPRFGVDCRAGSYVFAGCQPRRRRIKIWNKRCIERSRNAPFKYPMPDV